MPVATEDLARSSQYGMVWAVRSRTEIGTRSLAVIALKYALRGWMLQV